MREFLTEIRHLRSQLERCIDTNNDLRKKLEEHLVAKNQRQRVSMTNVYYAKDPSPVTSQGKLLSTPVNLLGHSLICSFFYVKNMPYFNSSELFVANLVML